MKLRFVLLTSLILACSLSAQIPLDGALSGVISAGWYTIEDEIHVEDGDSLTIMAGALLGFAENSYFTVSGYLCAEGSESDSITFESAGGFWKGISVIGNHDDEVTFGYCRIFETGENGLYVSNSTVWMHDCRIFDNTAPYEGGGIKISAQSTLNLDNCLISDNWLETTDDHVYGAGIYSDYSTLNIENCIFSGNSTSSDTNYAEIGTAVFHSNGEINITGCTFEDNTTEEFFTASVNIENSTVQISDCYFRDAYSDVSTSVALDNCNAIIENCSFANDYLASRGISCSESTDLILLGCEFIQNFSYFDTGALGIGIGCQFEVNDCNFIMNQAGTHGGAVFSFGNGTFTNCLFEGNHSDGGQGGALFFADGQVYIDSCSLIDNYSYFASGGAVCADGISNPVFNSCLFTGNNADEDGGVFYIYNGSVLLQNCTLFNNWCNENGSILCALSNPAMGDYSLEAVNCIFDSNNGDNTFYTHSNASLNLEYCSVSNRPNENFAGYNIPPEIEVLSQTNVNGDSCDVYYNIFLDPVFVNPAAGNYHLQWGSPCIDAGDPTSPLDPDSTIADIGAYYFDQLTSVENPAFNLQPVTCNLQPAYPNPFNASTTIPFTLDRAGRVKIDLYDITGRLVGAFSQTPLQKWYPAGTHEVVWDAEGMPSGIYFVRMETRESLNTQKIILLK